MPDHFDALETRDPEVRERDLLGRLLTQVAHAKTNAPGFARILKDVDPRAVTSRAALARLPVTRKSDLKALQAEFRPARRTQRHAGREAGEDLRVARPDLRAGGPRARLVAYGARAARGRLPRGRPRRQRLRLSLHPGRLDARERRARVRVHGGADGGRADRDAGIDDRRPRRQRLHRHAVVPEADRREGRRAEGRHLVPEEGDGRRRVPAAGAAQRDGRARA